MYGKQALRGLLFLDKGPHGEVESDAYRSLELDLWSHSAGLRLRAHIETVEGVTVRNVQDLEL